MQLWNFIEYFITTFLLNNGIKAEVQCQGCSEVCALRIHNAPKVILLAYEMLAAPIDHKRKKFGEFQYGRA